MSIIHNQNSQLWKDVLSTIRRIPAVREGVVLSKRDNETVSHAILMNVTLLKDCCFTSTPREMHNLKRWCITTKKLNIVVLDQMMKAILMRLRLAEVETYDNFKHCLPFDNSDIGAFMAPVKDILLLYLEQPGARNFRILNQFLSFMTRITLLDIDFQQESLDAYYATEERVKKLSFVRNPLIMELRGIVQEWLKPFVLTGIKPKHGPGGVAFLGKTSNYHKSKNMKFDQLLNCLIRNDEQAENWFVDKPLGQCRLAEVVFVAKNLSSMRTICMEPSSLMYYQQGVWSQLELYMGTHSVLSKRIRLTDQSYNRELSRIGSLNQRYATIDLSAASDSVTWKLMKALFIGTDYYKAALLTRSTHASLPDGNVIKLAKFAPMGSTMCFPTQCIIFAAICELVARRNGVRGQDVYSVYGDDIVIYETLAHEVADVLAQCGFLLNVEKSYLTGRFKESCGGEFFDGFDVTPLKIPRNYKGTILTSREPQLFSGTIDFVNECNVRKFKHTRNYLISRFESLPQTLRPLFDDGTRGIASVSPTNFHLKKAENFAHQYGTVEHGESKSSMQLLEDRVDDELSLLMWYMQADSREILDPDSFDPELPIIIRTAPSRNALRSIKSFELLHSDDLRYQYTLRRYAARQ